LPELLKCRIPPLAKSPCRLFEHKLAAQLGWPNVEAMLDTMTIDEFNEWWEYSKLEPFITDRVDYNNAMSMSLTANMNRDSKKQPEPFSPTDFLIEYNKQSIASAKPKSKLTEEEIQAEKITALFMQATASAKANGR